MGKEICEYGVINREIDVEVSRAEYQMIGVESNEYCGDVWRVKLP